MVNNTHINKNHKQSINRTHKKQVVNLNDTKSINTQKFVFFEIKMSTYHISLIKRTQYIKTLQKYIDLKNVKISYYSITY